MLYREVSEKDAKDYAESIHAIFVETSAKNAININEVFTEISECVFEYLMQLEPADLLYCQSNGRKKIFLLVDFKALKKKVLMNSICLCIYSHDKCLTLKWAAVKLLKVMSVTDLSFLETKLKVYGELKVAL